MGSKAKQQKVISWEHAKYHPGEVVIVRGMVVNFHSGYNKYGTRYRRIALGKKYPEINCLYLFINERFEEKYPDLLKEIVLGTIVTVEGKVRISDKSLTSITIERPSQLKSVDKQ